MKQWIIFLKFLSTQFYEKLKWIWTYHIHVYAPITSAWIVYMEGFYGSGSLSSLFSTLWPLLNHFQYETFIDTSTTVDKNTTLLFLTFLMSFYIFVWENSINYICKYQFIWLIDIILLRISGDDVHCTCMYTHPPFLSKQYSHFFPVCKTLVIIT